MMFPKEMLYLLIVCAVLTLVGYYLSGSCLSDMVWQSGESDWH